MADRIESAQSRSDLKIDNIQMKDPTMSELLFGYCTNHNTKSVNSLIKKLSHDSLNQGPAPELMDLFDRDELQFMR
jgi:hypothetical protein